jgi:hypothetical protein
MVFGLGDGLPAQEPMPEQVADTQFDPDRGYYTEPFDLTIVTETPDAEIWVTLDGSDPLRIDGTPSRDARPYTGPLTITTTTCVRAAAVKEGMLPTNVDTQTYLFLDDVKNFRQSQALSAGYPANWYGSYPADYEMDPEIVDHPDYRDQIVEALLSLPTVSIVTTLSHLFSHDKDPETGGIYIYTGHGSTGGQDWERPASVEYFGWDGSLTFQANCGIRIQGGENRNPDKCPKHGFSLRFREEYGPRRLEADLFGGPVTSFDSLQLRGFFNNSWIHWSAQQGRNAQYIRDQWMRDTMIDMGHVDAGSGRYVHLYLNGMYWGLYNLQERPVADHYASYHGGDGDTIDAINGGSATDGTSAAWNALKSTVASGNWSEIERVLDVDNFIDWTLLNLYGGNQDIKTDGNWRAAGGGPDARPWRFYPWDSERVLENVNQSLGTRPSGDPTGLLGALMDIPAFVTRFGDRVQRHGFHDGALMPAATLQRWQDRVNEIDLAVIAESARWGDYRRDVHQRYSPGILFTRNEHWLPEQSRLLQSYFPDRRDVLVSQLEREGLYPTLAAPAIRVEGLAQHGGHILATDAVSLHSAAGSIWYSLDGRDPQGDVIEIEDGPTHSLVSDSAAKKVLVPTAAVDSAWQGGAAFDDAGWLSTSGGVGYERSSGYDPYFNLDVEDQMYGQRTSCYIRIPFTVTEFDAQLWQRLHLQLRYDDGFVAYLNGHEIARANLNGTPNWQSSASSTHDDGQSVQWVRFDVSAALPYLRKGDNLLSVHGLNASASSSDFLIGAELFSQEVTPINPDDLPPNMGDPYTDPFFLERSTVLKARAFDGQNWSALTEAVFAVGPVAESLRISEIMYHPLETGDPNDPNAEYLELVNIGAETVNLTRVRFVDGVSFDFPAVDMAPQEVFLLVRNAPVFVDRYGSDLPVLGTYEGKLSNSGEGLAVADAAGHVFLDFNYKDGWYPSTDGDGSSLELIDLHVDPLLLSEKESWGPSVAGGTPGVVP